MRKRKILSIIMILPLLILNISFAGYMTPAQQLIDTNDIGAELYFSNNSKELLDENTDNTYTSSETNATVSVTIIANDLVQIVHQDSIELFDEYEDSEIDSFILGSEEANYADAYQANLEQFLDSF